MEKKTWKVYHLESSRDGKKTYWNKVGIGFTNKDDSINIHVQCLPIDGKLQLRDAAEEDRRGKPQGELGLAAPPITLYERAASAVTQDVPF